jgi:hypothetical protein
MFPAGEPGAGIARHHELLGTRRTLGELRPELPEPFIRAVQRSMSAEPAARWPTADGLRLELRRGVA